jgi:protein-S-isoprenylcysteine O-methyltransferase Ste14
MHLDPSSVANHRRNVVISILFVLFGGPGILLFFLPLWITHFHVPAWERWWQVLLSWILIVIGLVPVLESVVRFIYAGHGTLIPAVPPERLVVGGFYRFVRNPMYVGVMLALAGEALLFWRRGILIEALFAFIGFNLFVLLYEEPSLTRRYADDYLRYKKNVPRWLPRMSAWNNLES